MHKSREDIVPALREFTKEYVKEIHKKLTYKALF